MNYHDDHRVRAAEKWYASFDEATMTAVVGEHTVPCVYQVCPTCSGRGKHVNPSVDCDGLTASDFEQDPDLFESYMGGVYDVTCYGCQGQRVVPIMARDKMEPALLSAIDADLDKLEEYRAMARSERRFGA